VRIDGRAVAQATSLRALRNGRDGWTISTGPFPGIVLKLAPRGGTARAEVRLP